MMQYLLCWILYTLTMSETVVDNVSFSCRHAQVLAALKAWSHWVAQMQASSVDHSLVDRLIGDMVRATIALIQDHNEPSTLVHAAAHLLLTLTGTVKSGNLWNMDQIRSLYSDPLSHLESSVSLSTGRLIP